MLSYKHLEAEPFSFVSCPVPAGPLLGAARELSVEQLSL